MLMHQEIFSAPLLELVAEAEAAARQVPPLFPLDATVAVNPFLGQAGEPLHVAAARLARVAGVPATQPRAVLAARIADGTIADADLAAALDAAPAGLRPRDVAALKAAARQPAPVRRPLPTVAELAAEVSGQDWPGLVADRIGAWAAGQFDAGQALWAAPRTHRAYAEWRDFARRDLTPEIHGLTGFAGHVAALPQVHWRAMGQGAETLGIDTDAAGSVFHRLFCDLGGWAQLARGRLWQAELGGGRDTTLTELLAVRLAWEEALFLRYRDAIVEAWTAALQSHRAPVAADADIVVDTILQEAAERAAQRALAARLETPAERPAGTRPAAQAVFCIDVRSEVFRRALEGVAPEVRTLGFAGFFGIAAAHRRIASDVVEARCPALLTPGVASHAGMPDDADRDLRFAARARRAWGRFQKAAVSSFAFVEAAGPLYAARLVRDGFGLGRPELTDDAAPVADPALDLPARIAAAEGALRGMSLTEGFAPLVLMVGHGAAVTNNAHASALQCGACGGYAGDANARLLCAVLNDPAVRDGLAGRGIAIPQDTLFVAALHDTTADTVTLFDRDRPSPAHAGALATLARQLAAAGALARAERAPRLPRAESAADLLTRGRDWAELRPEWGLAGCGAFIAAPRALTEGRSLEGRAFLHSYDWQADRDFATLELILTAPVVVASWISLQYYGSSVAPELFGAGNKLLHNVTGGIGVVEGNGGRLRGGLPWQSVHDGRALVHDPLRLSVAVAAPAEAITDILKKHPGLRDLFDARWLHLFRMDDDGRLAERYVPGLSWTAAFPEPDRAAEAPRDAAA